MTNEERDLIIQFIGRTGGRPATSGFAATVPSVGGPELPPVDPQADALIGELFVRYPEARYRLTQLAFIQEHALAAASGQLEQLKQQNAQLQQQLQQMAQPAAPAGGSPWGQPAPAQPPSRGLFGGLFGGGQPAPQPQYAPQPQPQYAPQYAPGYQPGMFQRGGSGFLGSALTTAAGVAGGIMAADAIGGLLHGNSSAQAASFGSGGLGAPTSFPAADASPWAPAAPALDSYDQGGAAKDSSWANAAPAQDSGWQDASNGGDSGWTDSGGGGDYDNS
jgi:hypothetical protein